MGFGIFLRLAPKIPPDANSQCEFAKITGEFAQNTGELVICKCRNRNSHNFYSIFENMPKPIFWQTRQ